MTSVVFARESAADDISWCPATLRKQVCSQTLVGPGATARRTEAVAHAATGFAPGAIVRSRAIAQPNAVLRPGALGGQTQIGTQAQVCAQAHMRTRGCADMCLRLFRACADPGADPRGANTNMSKQTGDTHVANTRHLWDSNPRGETPSA